MEKSNNPRQVMELILESVRDPFDVAEARGDVGAWLREEPED